MLELTGLAIFFIALGVVVLIAKIFFKLILLPVTLGLWVGKLLFGLLFTFLGGIALLALLPLTLLALPALIVALVFGLLALPVVLLVKILV